MGSMKLLSVLNKAFSHRFAPLVAFIMIAAVFAMVSQHQLDHLRDTDGRLAQTQNKLALTQKKLALTQAEQAAQVHAGCVRLNIELADENNSHFDDFDFYSQILQSNADAASTDAALLKKFGIVLSAKLKKDEADEIGRLKHDIDTKTWTPLINCNSVTSGKYKVPEPIPFVKKLPPKSALESPPQPPSNPGHQGVNN